MNESWWERLAFAAITALVLLGISAIVLMARSDGRIDYCVIESIAARRPYYELWGHRPWSPNIAVGAFDSFDGAVDAAGKIGCRLDDGGHR